MQLKTKEAAIDIMKDGQAFFLNIPPRIAPRKKHTNMISRSSVPKLKLLNPLPKAQSIYTEIGKKPPINTDIFSEIEIEKRRAISIEGNQAVSFPIKLLVK